MAVGDILSVEIGADGWYADVTVAGVSTGGTYAFGLGANNDPATGTPKLAFTVTSLGFDDTGAATTIVRTVYATKQVRKAYPNHAANEETVVGSDVKVRVALSDYIYAKDQSGVGNSGTDVTAVALSGLYTQGGTPSNARSSFTVTNSSTWAYPKVVGNWSWPGYEKRAASFKLRAVAFHVSAQQGRPVRCVKFTATDGTNTATSTVTAPTVDTTIAGALPVTEYVGTLDASALTQGAVLTENFIAYPWIGDTAACLDTSGGTAQPTPLYGPAKSVCDKTGAYAPSVAVVDSVSGNDGTGAVTASFDSGSPPAAYATIAGALTGLKTYNNTNYSRNNPGGSTVYLKAGSHAWIGGTYTAGTAPDAWAEITRFPGLLVSDVTIATQSGGKAASSRAKVTGVTWTAQSATGVVTGQTHLWVDQCVINAPTGSQPPFYVNTAWYATRNTVTSLNQGFAQFSTVNAAPAIVRGNAIASAGSTVAYMVLGNTWASVSGNAIKDNAAGQTVPTVVNTVMAYNRLQTAAAGFSSTTVSLRQLAGTGDSHGLAFVQNIVEALTNSSPALVQIAADATTNPAIDNALIWHNVVVGQRINLGYNEVDTASGGGVAYRRGWSMRNNLFDDPNIKSDTFAGSGYVADGAKIGNWPLLFGVACSGNLHGEYTAIGVGGTFCWDFAGVKSDQAAVTGQPPTCTSRAGTYPLFVDRKSWNGSITGAGGGNYNLQATSPAIALQRDYVLPYDLAGSARSAINAAGAYAAAGVSGVYVGSIAVTAMYVGSTAVDALSVGASSVFT